MICKPHVWIEISKSALEHNLRVYKQAIGVDKLMGCVVKSNAYGHGIVEVARICQETGAADWLFTATLSEALLLRAQGITLPILVMYFIDEDPRLAIENNIHLIVSDKEMLEELNVCSKSLHDQEHMNSEKLLNSEKQINKRFKVHIKIDTGMSRFGFLPSESLELVKYARSLPGIEVTGIYSHLAQAAAADQSYSIEQQAQFCAVIEKLKEEGIQIPFKHLTSTGGTTALSQKYTNIVRVGLGCYGWWPSIANKELTQKNFPEFELKPVLTLKTKIYQIRQLEAGKYVGYDSTHKTVGPTRIAVLPVGYYDGYDRRLSNKGLVLINNQYAQVIGIVAMTTILADITSIADAKVGDEVALIGNYERITPTQIAHDIGSFNAREILTRLNPLIPRIIVP